jgi:alpha-D-ribose 1-methylphosphonate 5-triphosphate diphosphatase
VLDALRAGSFEPWSSAASPQRLAKALAEAKARRLLRADHLIHLRCELPCPDTTEVAEAMARDPNVKLISVMDHTPGERQFVTIEKFRDYYLGKRIMAADQLELFISERRELRDSHSSRNRTAVVALARHLGLTPAITMRHWRMSRRPAPRASPLPSFRPPRKRRRRRIGRGSRC